MSTRRCFFVSAVLALMLVGVVPALTSGAGGPCSPKTPQYCPPPRAKTGQATHVKATSATLNGTVNPNGSATTCFFEYGPSRKYGSTTPRQNVGSGTKTVHVSAKVTGLARRTTYHFQLVCRNLGGRALGGDRRFKRPPHVITRKATKRRRTSVILRGSVNPHGSATRCRFHYGPTRRYGLRTKVKKVGAGTRGKRVAARVGGLKPGTVYHFRLFCTNAGGTAHGRDRRVETRRGP